MSGSNLDVEWADGHVSAILQAFYPGSSGGKAVADILFGAASPSGKLPVTFYRKTGDLPDFCDYNMENRTYRYFKGDPLYPFGFGLTYSTFELSVLEAGRESCCVRVKNTGGFEAGQVVQVYVESPGQKERWNLCGFAPVALAPGQEKQVVRPCRKRLSAATMTRGICIRCRGDTRCISAFRSRMSEACSCAARRLWP